MPQYLCKRLAPAALLARSLADEMLTMMPHSMRTPTPRARLLATHTLALSLALTLCATLNSGCEQDPPTTTPSPSPAPHHGTQALSQPSALLSPAQAAPPALTQIEGAEALDMKTALALRAEQRHDSSDDCDNDSDSDSLSADPILHRHELSDPLAPDPLVEATDAADTLQDTAEAVLPLVSAAVNSVNSVLVIDQTPTETFVIPTGLPRNTRRVREGYWIGGRPALESEIQSLYDAGVRVIISGVILEERINKQIARLGIKHLRVPFGQEFPEPDKLLEATAGKASSEVFVHCEHGGDRSGAMIAFFLVIRNGWRPDHALLAMTAPNKRDVDGQLAMLREAGLHITQEELDTYLGIYSGQRNGGVGGLKVRDKGYRRLVFTTLQAMAAKGAQLNETAAKGNMAMAGRPDHVLEMP
jgi:hypothetical protein